MDDRPFNALVMETQVIEALRTCFDPEIPVNIYDLGLIYEIEANPSGTVGIKMTLTSPSCPAAGSIPPDVEAKVRLIPGVRAVKVDVVFDPPWDRSMMSETAKLDLGML
jgi:FeS assembly SUF system protein